MAGAYFTRLKVGYPDERNYPVDQPNSWKIFTICDLKSVHSCRTIKDVCNLESEADVNVARLLFRDLLNKANTGLNFSDLYDEKICHEAHSFKHDHKEIKIYRLRRSEIRTYFIYLSGKIVVLIKTNTKRSNKLTKGEKEELEKIATEILDQVEIEEFNDRIIV